MNHQSGLGLSELLVCLFLTCFILTGLIQSYLNNKRQYIEVQKQLDARFDLQWVSEWLSDSIRRAGFTPCLRVTQLKRIDSRNFKSSIPDIKISDPPLSFIQINRMSEHFTGVIAIQSPTELIVSKGILFKELHPILIVDCSHAEIHQILNVEKLGKNDLIRLTKPLTFSYSKSTYVGEWLEEQWFIKQNSRKINTLHYRLYQVEELTPLVHSLHIKPMLIGDKQLVEIEMELDNNKTQKLVVAIRGS